MRALAPWTMPVPLDRRPRLSATGLNHVRHQREAWKLDRLWTFHLFMRRVEWSNGERDAMLKRGQAVLTPPNIHQQYHCPSSRGSGPYWYWAHFWFEEGSSQAVALPMMVDFEERAQRVERAFGQMMRNNADDVERAEVQLWELLHSLKDARPRRPVLDVDDRMEATEAARFIEVNLGRPLSVPDVAKHVGVSQSHLTRLFRRRFKTTIVGYIHRCRVQRAEHMLRFSDMPIKVIAVDVGVPDLQQFNKLIRKEFNLSPRGVREWEQELREQRRAADGHAPPSAPI